MILPPEYNWLESYLDNNSLWLEDSLNWEAAFEIALYDYTLYSALTTPFFINSYFFLDSIFFLDIIFFFESDKSAQTRELYDLFLWNITSLTSNKFLPTQFLFYTDCQDHIVILLHLFPELILTLTDYLDIYWIKTTFPRTSVVIFGLFNDLVNLLSSKFFEDFLFFIFFILSIMFVLNFFKLTKTLSTLNSHLNCLINHFYFIAKEFRAQFGIMLMVFFLFYWIIIITALNGDEKTLIWAFDAAFCCSLFVAVYLVFKYFKHCFALFKILFFEKHLVSCVTKQFARSFNIASMLLLQIFILFCVVGVFAYSYCLTTVLQDCLILFCCNLFILILIGTNNPFYSFILNIDELEAAIISILVGTIIGELIFTGSLIYLGYPVLGYNGEKAPAETVEETVEEVVEEVVKQCTIGYDFLILCGCTVILTLIFLCVIKSQSYLPQKKNKFYKNELMAILATLFIYFSKSKIQVNECAGCNLKSDIDKISSGSNEFTNSFLIEFQNVEIQNVDKFTDIIGNRLSAISLAVGDMDNTHEYLLQENILLIDEVSESRGILISSGISGEEASAFDPNATRIEENNKIIESNNARMERIANEIAEYEEEMGIWTDIIGTSGDLFDTLQILGNESGLTFGLVIFIYTLWQNNKKKGEKVVKRCIENTAEKTKIFQQTESQDIFQQAESQDIFQQAVSRIKSNAMDQKVYYYEGKRFGVLAIVTAFCVTIKLIWNKIIQYMDRHLKISELLNIFSTCFDYELKRVGNLNNAAAIFYQNRNYPLYMIKKSAEINQSDQQIEPIQFLEVFRDFELKNNKIFTVAKPKPMMFKIKRAPNGIKKTFTVKGTLLEIFKKFKKK